MDALKSWKSTVAGLASIAAVAAFLMGRITLNDLVAAIGIFTGAGLVLTKDASKQ